MRLSRAAADEGVDLHEYPSQASTKKNTPRTDSFPPKDGHLSPVETSGVLSDSQTHIHSHGTHESTASSHHEHVETRARHCYTIRRPRALQFSYRSQVIHAGDERGTLAVVSSHHSSISSHLPEDIAKERERLDLFVDLIWVGIISNLSEVYSSIAFRAGNPDAALATLIFFLVFLPSWRIWDAMREFLNNYYMDDMTQRCFTFWILFASVFYGNQLAFLSEDLDDVKIWLISIYLIIHASFLTIEMVYSFFIVWLRKLVFFQWVLRMPSLALWMTAVRLKGARAIGPIFGAIVWEYLVPVIIDSKWAEKLTPIEHKKALDTHHFQSRFSSFFIIILGEGVLQLVKDGPLGVHLQSRAGIMAFVLLIYYELSFLYFNRDGSQRFVPAATSKRGWKTLFWVFWHIPLFASILTFAASVMFILRHQPDEPFNSPPGEGGTTSSNSNNTEPISEDRLPGYLYSAIWTCTGSLAMTMFSMTAIALSDKSMDEPGTLKISNRYVRLSMRAVFIAVVMALPAAHLSVHLYLGILALMLFMVGVWEWNVSLDQGGQIIEPLGLSTMMSRN